MKNVPTTASSQMLRDYVSPYESTVTQRLLNAGAVTIGKTNMDEFGMGSSTTYSIFGPTINPWTKPGQSPLVAGGSSGGSAAAVASGCCFAAMGSDTGGSVRQPAAFCGVVGFKPNYGRISRYGLIAYASSLDTPGIFTRSVRYVVCRGWITLLDDVISSVPIHSSRDAALMYQILAGYDDKDSTSLDKICPSVPDLAEATRGMCSLEGLHIGIPQEYHVEEMPLDMLNQWQAGIDRLESLGAKVLSVSLPSTKYAMPMYYVLACAEASSNLARYDGVRYGHRAAEVEPNVAKVEPNVENRDNPAQALHDLYAQSRSEGFGPEVQRRILSGTFVLSEGAYEDYYERASVLREQVREEFKAVFDTVDALLTPTTPTGPFSIEYVGSEKNPVEMYLQDILTIPASLAGLPAMSVPTAVMRSSDHQTPVPVGLQLITAQEQEHRLLVIGQALERGTSEELNVRRPAYVQGARES